jgi:hypothetical protein
MVELGKIEDKFTLLFDIGILSPCIMIQYHFLALTIQLRGHYFGNI